MRDEGERRWISRENGRDETRPMKKWSQWKLRRSAEEGDEEDEEEG